MPTDDVLAKVQFGAGISRVVECPKGMVGRVIGKGGETIKALQRTYQVGQSTGSICCCRSA